MLLCGVYVTPSKPLLLGSKGAFSSQFYSEACRCAKLQSPSHCITFVIEVSRELRGQEGAEGCLIRDCETVLQMRISTAANPSKRTSTTTAHHGAIPTRRLSVYARQHHVCQIVATLPTPKQIRIAVKDAGVLGYWSTPFNIIKHTIKHHQIYHQTPSNTIN